jgi:RNA polymerase sigma-70 factor (ECF subfamily)
MDEKAEFQELFVTHLDSVHSYALLLSRNASEADDLLQETLLRAFRAFGSFKRHLSFKVWAFKIMKNAQIDRVRRVRVRPVEAKEDWHEHDGQIKDLAEEVLLYPVPLNPEEIFLRLVTIEQVREAIRNLPTPLREVVELREIEGLSYRDIATVIGKPVGTVMSRLYRGRNLIRSVLQAPSLAGVESRSVYGL